ncbi:MAG: hypothetical protein ABIG93_04875 [archaeon]|nr:hypothetical protein [Nanoarchaeota archaeon]
MKNKETVEDHTPHESHKHHEEILIDDFDHEETFSEKHPLAKKLILLGASILMIFLMFSFIFVTFPIDNIIKSALESDPLEGNVIDTGQFQIIFENGTEKELETWYLGEQETEFSTCLQGYLIDGDYYITDMYQPEMYLQTFNHVQFESCSEDTIIMLHTHPYKSCLASDTDLETLEKTRDYNPDVLMVIMCEPDKFSVY